MINMPTQKSWALQVHFVNQSSRIVAYCRGLTPSQAPCFIDFASQKRYLIVFTCSHFKTEGHFNRQTCLTNFIAKPIWRRDFEEDFSFFDREAYMNTSEGENGKRKENLNKI